MHGSYLKNRGINIETAKRWQIGYAPNAWDSLVRWATAAGFVKEELIESGLVKLREEGNPRSHILRSISRSVDVSDLQ